MDLSTLSPYLLGESKSKEAIKYLLEYLQVGTPNDKRLAASAIRKISIEYPEECRVAINYLIRNISEKSPQIRQYSLQALKNLNISETDKKTLSVYYQAESKDYNMALFRDILAPDSKSDTGITEGPLNFSVVEECSADENNKADRNDVNNYISQSYHNEPNSENRLWGFEGLAYFERKDFFGFLDYLNAANYNFALPNYRIHRILKAYKSKNCSGRTHLQYNSSAEMEYIVSKYEEVPQYREKIKEYIESNEIFNLTDGQIESIFSSNSDVDEDIQQHFFDLRVVVSEKMQELINECSFTERDATIASKRLALVGRGTETLAVLGSEYGISRERVRQIEVRCLRRATRRIFRKNTDTISENALWLKLIFDKFKSYKTLRSERFILFVVNSFPELNPMSIIKNANKLFNFNDDELKRVLGIYIDNKFEHEKRIKYLFKKDEIFKTRLLKDVLWSKNVASIDPEHHCEYGSVREVNLDNDYLSGSFVSNKLNKTIYYESSLEKRVLSIVEEASAADYYVVQPFKIPYGNNRIYVPDIFVVLSDGRGIIIEVKPKIYMLLKENLVKYTAMKEYCINNGYGFLVTDGYTSVTFYKEAPYSKVFEHEVIAYLRQNHSANWGIIKSYMDKYLARLSDLNAVIYHNRLVYQKSPFCLRLDAK